MLLIKQGLIAEYNVVITVADNRANYVKGDKLITLPGNNYRSVNI